MPTSPLSRSITDLFHGVTHKDWRNMLVFTSLETFAVGWIDVTYVFKYGCFVTMMTGNVVQMGRSLAQGKDGWAGAAFYLVLIFTFWVGVASFRTLQHCLGEHSKRSFNALFLFYYALYIITSNVAYTPSGPEKWPVIFLPPMYGVHGAIMIKKGLGKYPGIAMTSNSVNLNYFLFDVMIKGWKNISDGKKHNAYVIFGNFLGICLGAACSGLWLYLNPDHVIHSNMISVPPVAILVLLTLWNDSFFEQDARDMELRSQNSEDPLLAAG